MVFPTAYRQVPTITTAGTGMIMISPAWEAETEALRSEIKRLRARLELTEGELAALDASHKDLAKKLANMGAINAELVAAIEAARHLFPNYAIKEANALDAALAKARGEANPST